MSEMARTKVRLAEMYFTEPTAARSQSFSRGGTDGRGADSLLRGSRNPITASKTRGENAVGFNGIL